MPCPNATLPALSHLPVLVVDCQTTGASPERGHLLEVAWARSRADSHSPEVVESTLVALPDGVQIPPRVTSLTGIRTEDLDGAPSPADVWRRLDGVARALADDLCVDDGRAPAVAHFARFERAFLEALHREHSGGRGPFPLDLTCTHELACRLLPGLPRRGLRALAGRIASPLGELKRAAEHVRATLAVWSDFCARLDVDHGVRTLPDLQTWMRDNAATRRGGRDFAVPRRARLDLPERPGVYRMLGRGGEVLYVGKATSLRRRVNGYFQKRRHSRDDVLEMLTQTWAVDVTPTASPLEAALLEVDEIKGHEPPYNTALRGRSGQVHFLDRDLQELGTRPDGRLVLGPLPRREVADAWVTLRGLLSAPADDADPADVRVALDLPASVSLETEPAREGLDAFARAAGWEECRPPALRALLVAGLRLWRRMLEEREAEREAPSDDGPEEEVSTVWTAERVAAALRGSLLRGTHLLRRAHWLVGLSESSLVWRPPGADGETTCRLLVVERGRVVRAADTRPTSPAPLPPGWPRASGRRLACFDVATYDRLRVLTTELRRLVAQGGHLELCLGPHRRFGRGGLARRLRWV